MFGLPGSAPGRVRFEVGSSRFEVEPERGGRMVSAGIGEHELLIGPNAHPENYGSTFWTSPQSDWEWPPVVAVDSGPYAVRGEAPPGSLLLESAEVSGTGTLLDGLRVRKRYASDPASEALDVEYTLVNGGAAPKRLAPWEITRVGPFGLTFFAATRAPWTTPGRVLPDTAQENGALWFQYTQGVTHHAKLFSDGSGWIAHVTPERLLLVKRFRDLSTDEFAPGEAEIEVYASNPPGAPEGRYVEVENQGAYASIAPGGAASWCVRWYLRVLPESLAVRPGSEALVRFVERLIAQ